MEITAQVLNYYLNQFVLVLLHSLCRSSWCVLERCVHVLMTLRNWEGNTWAKTQRGKEEDQRPNWNIRDQDGDDIQLTKMFFFSFIDYF